MQSVGREGGGVSWLRIETKWRKRVGFLMLGRESLKNCKSAPEDRRASNDKGQRYRGLSTPPRKEPRGSGRDDAFL